MLLMNKYKRYNNRFIKFHHLTNFNGKSLKSLINKDISRIQQIITNKSNFQSMYRKVISVSCSITFHLMIFHFLSLFRTKYNLVQFVKQVEELLTQSEEKEMIISGCSNWRA